MFFFGAVYTILDANTRQIARRVCLHFMGCQLIMRYQMLNAQHTIMPDIMTLTSSPCARDPKLHSFDVSCERLLLNMNLHPCLFSYKKFTSTMTPSPLVGHGPAPIPTGFLPWFVVVTVAYPAAWHSDPNFAADLRCSVVVTHSSSCVVVQENASSVPFGPSTRGTVLVTLCIA
jgi:hypothetical protein